MAADALAAIRGAKSGAKLSQRTEVSALEVRGPQELLDQLALTIGDVRAAGSVTGEVSTTADPALQELVFEVTLDA